MQAARQLVIPGVTLVLLVVFEGRAIAQPAAVFCSTETDFDLLGTPVLPFGGEIIGAGLFTGEIVNTRVHIRFRADNGFDAANIAVALTLPISQIAGIQTFGWSGFGLGWSGPGEFGATLETDRFNGIIGEPEGGLWFWMAEMVNLNPGAGPIEGEILELNYVLEFAACGRGDVNCDGSVNFFDIDPLLLALFDASAYTISFPDCDRALADASRDGRVDFFDIDPFLLCLFGGACG